MRRGKKYEDRAVDYLRSIGYRILRRNYHCRFGEIDVIAQDGQQIVFVEVKGGKDLEFGHPAEKFDTRKLSRVIACAYSFLEREGLEKPFRIDLVVVLRSRVEHFKNLGYESL